MKLQTYKRINKNDYPLENRPLVDRLSESLNVGLENLYLALQKRLTRRENMVATEKDLTVTTDSNGIPLAQTFFDLDFPGKAVGLVIERADNQTNPNLFPTSGVFATWSQSGSTITIRHITGLQPNNQYFLHITVNG